MINPERLLKDLQKLLPKIEKDILEYSNINPELTEHLKQEHNDAIEANRTAEHFVSWREAKITQSAVAWILTCVYVRFLEDNQLLNKPVLSGSVGDKTGDKRLQYAKDHISIYFEKNPTHEEREYLLALFNDLTNIPVMAELLDVKHNPLCQVPVSADGAKLLIDFFQKIDPESGEIIHDFTDQKWDTRFLGDLYQDLSEAVRKRYALLQTPDFIENFILDYTLEKAKQTFGLPGLRLIDPTCGSGHFLLSSFERLFNDWLNREPATNTRELAQRALDAVYGVDINPYAVAICKFRLMIAALKVAGCQNIITDAPDFHFNVAVGDSLLHGKRFESTGGGNQGHIMAEDDPIRHVLEVEDKDKLSKILGQQYHAVVGNPPYITVADKALNTAYREKYSTCHRKYSLAVPFTERFFDLTLSDAEGKPAGYMGMITTNSFMKREFGKKLIQDYLPQRDLTHIVDTSGVNIPGHGTPTVILFARNQYPKSTTVRSVLGIKGETSSKDDTPSKRPVWCSIIDLIEKPDSENDFITVADLERDIFSSHPWSLEGGGASELMNRIDHSKETLLSRFVDSIGFGAILGEDDAFCIPNERIKCSQAPSPRKAMVVGKMVRNWKAGSLETVVFPYSDKIILSPKYEIKKWLWPLREYLYYRKAFSGLTYKESGRHFIEYHQIPKVRNQAKFLITFPFVATHNHFVLDRGGRLFNRTSPIIKLPKGTKENDHLVLLGLLNSSVACFWGRQTLFPKGGFADGKWEERLEWDGTKLKTFPIPQANETNQDNTNDRLLIGYSDFENLARKIDKRSQQLAYFLPDTLFKKQSTTITANRLQQAKKEYLALINQMVTLQEELDWLCYHYYGLLDEAIIYKADVPEIKPGERAFEIALAQQIKEGTATSAWFERHQITPITSIPDHWPDSYKKLVEKRLSLINEERFIKLIEQPEYKRRWFPVEWEKKEQQACKDWLLNEIETQCFTENKSVLMTAAQIADQLRKDDVFMTIAKLYVGKDLFDLQAMISQLLADDHVPQMAACRYKPNAMEKYRAWQETWEKQRQEDAIDAEFGVTEDAINTDEPNKLAEYSKALELAAAKKADVVGDIPKPPTYTKANFRRASYSVLRGKLDVPKEHFFSLPGCEKEGDSTLVVGWAGMDHLQRAQAIAAWYIERKDTEGWEAEKLKPMLVALDELIPWLKQWHNEIDPEYGERMGDFYEGFLLEECRFLEISRDELLVWQPSVF